MASTNDANYDRLSMVPLMKPKEGQRRQYHDQLGNDQDWSDQEIDEFTQDPLENVLMQMRLWPQAITRQQCVRSAVFTGIVSVCLGFVFGYVLFILLAPSHSCADVLKRDPLIEKRFLGSVDAAQIKQFSMDLSVKSIFPGSEADLNLAKNISNEWKKHGFDVSIVPYNLTLAYLNATKPSVVEVIDKEDNVVFKAATLMLPNVTFNSSDSKSFSNECKRYLVYVNYGRDEDYKTLQNSNVVVKDNIVLVRLGKVNLYEKLQTAQKYNVCGVLLYPDPKEYAPNGPEYVYPKTIWLPGNAIKYEPVDMFSDPSMTGAYWGRSASNFVVQCINYNDAEKLLQYIEGESSPAAWKGTLNSNYNIGTSEMQVRITAYVVTRIVNIQNVIGVLKGHTDSDRYVLIGNHRDSIMPGGVEPHSGTAILLELARVFGKLAKQGWKPRRTIYFCSWSAGVDGPVGSSHWTKEYSKVLSERAVSYLNLNAAVQGNRSLQAVSVPILHQLLLNVTKTVLNMNDKNSNQTSVQRHLTKTNNKDFSPKFIDPLMNQDYSPFINTLGIPVIDLRYENDNFDSSYPLRHTALDDYHLVASLDYGFLLHKSIAQMYGLLLIRLADSALLPFHVEDYAAVIEMRLQSLLNQTSKVLEFNKDISLEPLKQAVEVFKLKCKEFQRYLVSANLKSWQTLRQINDQLMQIERAFINPHGLSCLPEFTHVIFSRDLSEPEDYSFPCLDSMLHELVKQNISYAEQGSIAKEISSIAFALRSAALVLQNAL